MLDFSNPQLLLVASIVFAAIPAIIWLYILFKKEKTSKKTISLVFGLGCLTAPALLGIQELWIAFPRFNLATLIDDNITTQSTKYILTFVLFGAMEEIIKMYVVTLVDKHTIFIRRIGDAIRYSLVAALGFSFAENIYYLFQFWPSLDTQALVGMYIFRSIFTACAHMIFSGIFGYFYGIGKYAIHITKQQELAGEKDRGSGLIAKLFNLPRSQAYQQKMVIKGLFLAVVLHAAYNFILQINIVPPVIVFVVLGYIYLRYLLSRKAGHLVLTTDISIKEKSLMAKKDEEVVLELLGMWFKDKRYIDVIHTCERLLERDPDNTVVKLFKAKAIDKMDDKDTYKSILQSILPSHSEMSNNQKNIITKHIEEKEYLRKVKQAVKKQLEKEGKSFIETKKTPPVQESDSKKTDPSKKEESFKLNL